MYTTIVEEEFKRKRLFVEEEAKKSKSV